MVYLDRHRVGLLLTLAGLLESERAAHTEEAELFLSTALDGADSNARAAFLAVVEGLEGWPWSGLLSRELDFSEYEGLLNTIEYAPPAIVLLLGVDLVDPDSLQPSNWISDETWATLLPRIQRWSPEAMQSAIGADGWQPISADTDEIPPEDTNDAPPLEPAPQAQGDGAEKGEELTAPSPAPEPIVPWYRRRSVLIPAGVVSALTIGLVIVARRR